MKKVIIIILSFMFCLFTVNSALIDNNEAYYKWDSSLTEDSTGNYTLTNSGNSLNTGGKIGNASDFTGSSHMTAANGAGTDGLTEGTVNLWLKLDDELADYNIFAKASAAFRAQYSSSTDSMIWQVNSEGMTFRAGNGLDWTQYHMVTYTWTSSNKSIYIDGSLSNDTSLATSSPSGTLYLGHNSVNTNERLKGLIDEFGTWSRALTDDEIESLYNGGAGLQYPYSVATTINITNPTAGEYLNTTNFPLNVTFNQNVNSTYILNGGNETTLGTDENVSGVDLVGVEGVNNITVIADNGVDEENESISFTIDTINPSLSVAFPTEYNYYGNFDFTQYINFSDANIDTCIVTISDESSSTCTETNFNFTYNGNKTFSVTATDLAGNTNTSSGHVMLLNPSVSFTFNASGTPLDTYTFGGRSDVAGVVTYSIYNDGVSLGNNSLLFEKLGYLSQNFNFELTNTTNTNFSYDVSLASINAQIFDRKTEALITDNITVQLVGPVGTTTTTTSGTVELSILNGSSGEYQIIASTANYETETIYFTYTNQQNLSLKIYMLNSSQSNAGTLNVQVKDSLSFLVEGATVDLLEWKPSSSSYLSVAQCQTAPNGICVLNIELTDKLYKIQAQKDSIVKTTNAQIISVDGSTITITLEDVVLSETPDLENVVSNFTETLVGNVSTTRLQWTDTDGVVALACIKTYKNTGFSQQFLSQNCTNSSSGILFAVNNINNSYALVIKGTIDYSGTSYTIGEFFHASTADISQSLESNGLDIFVPVVFLFIAIATGLFFGNIYISLALIVILEWLATAIAPSVMTAKIAIIITVFCGLIFWGVSKK